MNKEYLKSVLLVGLILLTFVMTKNLLDSKTPDSLYATASEVSINKSSPNIERIIYPQDFVIGFGGGSYTGVYSEDTREGIWNITSELLPAYLSQLDLVVIDEEEFRAIEKTRSVQMRMPFPISLNTLGEVYGVDQEFHEILNDPIEEIIISSSQQNRLYLANLSERQYFYLKGPVDDERIIKIINNKNKDSFTEYRRVDNLINFKALKEDEVQTFHNEEIIPITSVNAIPFVKVTKEIDALADRQNSEVKTFLIKAFGNSTDFIKRLEEIDGSQTYIYGYGDKALRLGIDGKITYQEKLETTKDTKAVTFREGLEIALEFADGYGNTPKSLYLSDYKESTDDTYEVKTYYFDYRVRELNVYTKSMQDGHAISVEITNDVVTKFTKNVRRYVKSIDASEIWSAGPMYVDALINENFDIISRNFNEDNDMRFADRDAQWQMSTYVLSIMQSLNNVELYYYLDSALDDERLIPAWRLEIANTMYYFHVYTGDILMTEKIVKTQPMEISKR